VIGHWKTSNIYSLKVNSLMKIEYNNSHRNKSLSDDNNKQHNTYNSYKRPKGRKLVSKVKTIRIVSITTGHAGKA
jgi:hypothetical protein